MKGAATHEYKAKNMVFLKILEDNISIYLFSRRINIDKNRGSRIDIRAQIGKFVPEPASQNIKMADWHQAYKRRAIWSSVHL